MRFFVPIFRSISLVAAAAALACSGCSSPPDSTRTGTHQGIKAEDALARLAERQSVQPDAAARSLPPPPGLDEALVTPIPEGDEKARIPLHRIAKDSPCISKPEPHPQGDPEPEAVRRYVAGRAKLLDGRAADALIDLQAAAQLDPNAAEIWREIGEANLILSRRGQAVQAFERAVSLGLREARPLTLLGRDYARARKHDDALRMLLAAREEEQNAPSAYLAVIDTELASVLRELGYQRGARDAILEGLEALVPGPAAAPRSYPEINEVFRKRGELALLAGDLSVRLGDLKAAGEAYGLAASAPAVDATDVLRRQVHLELRQGLSARASMAVLKRLITDDGRVDDRVMPLVTFLARHTLAGEPLAEAVASLAVQREGSLPASSRSRLVRTAAASLPGKRGADLLRHYLRETVRDERAAIDFLASLASARAMADEMIALLTRAPQGVETLADAVISYGAHIDAVCDTLARDRRAHAALLHSALLLRLGKPDAAMHRAPSPNADPVFSAHATALRCEAAHLVGNAPAVEEALGALGALAERSSSPEVRRALAGALHKAGRSIEAYQAIIPIVEEAAAPDARLLIEAATLASMANEAEASRALLRRAIESDPFDESAYDGLLALHAPTGQLAADSAVADVARDLRRRIPDSRLVRLITGQEYLARSLWAQAQEAFLALMDENFEQPQALDMLVLVWERSAATNSDLSAAGETWLRERLERRKQSPLLLMALARVLAVRGKAGEGEALLAERLERWPIPEMARVREWIVRDGLKDPERADLLAQERLERAPPTFDNAVELAELKIRRGDVGGAAKSLARGLATMRDLSPQASRRVLGLLSQFRADAPGQDGAAAARAVVEAFDAAVERGIPASPAIMLTRLAFVVRASPEDTDAIIEGVRRVGGANSDALLPACARALDALTTLDDISPALRFLPRAAALFEPPRDELLFEWYRLTVVRGDGEDIERFLREADAERMLGILARAGDEIEIPDGETAQRVELAYAVGVALSSMNRTDLALATYRRVLRDNPEHAWTCNNLGYMILETGGDLAEADRLIAKAHEQLPQDYHVTDSLAWVRYKRGIIADVPGEDGRPLVEGALSLLRRAVVDQGGEADPTILDHYADALWRSGQMNDALTMWGKAQRRLEDMLLPWEMRRQSDPALEDPPMAVRLRKELELVKTKVDAAQAGREPPVAPFASQEAP